MIKKLTAHRFFVLLTLFLLVMQGLASKIQASETELEIINAIESQIINFQNSQTVTGKNTASANTKGGKIQTGNAITSIIVNNKANLGIILLEFSSAQEDETQVEISIDNSYKAKLDNSLTESANTGQNVVSQNILSDMETGSSQNTSELENNINTQNIFIRYSGNSESEDRQVSVDLVNYSEIYTTNSLTGRANSGDNQANQNTSTGRIKTGYADLNRRLFNDYNINTTFLEVVFDNV